MTTEQAAQYLGLSIHTLANWRYLGKGPRFYRTGSLIRYDRQDVDAWLESCLEEGVQA